MRRVCPALPKSREYLPTASHASLHRSLGIVSSWWAVSAPVNGALESVAPTADACTGPWRPSTLAVGAWTAAVLRASSPPASAHAHRQAIEARRCRRGGRAQNLAEVESCYQLKHRPASSCHQCRHHQCSCNCASHCHSVGSPPPSTSRALKGSLADVEYRALACHCGACGPPHGYLCPPPVVCAYCHSTS